MRPRIVAGLLALSATGLISIAGHEAWRARTYDDGVGVNTIGWGQTTPAWPSALCSSV
jgi:lysozyme